ncbi:head-tail joining protein [Rhodopila sp.]|uniref:head-tail joining protein n=1 Tax=Rhodopila sp. TaxID=2480087 RepID=UPI003D0F71BE
MIDFDALVLAPCHATFGELVTYYPASGPPTPLPGIFNDRYMEIKLQDGVEIVDYRTVVAIRASLFPMAPPNQAELIRARGVLYVITNVEPDGLGDLRLSLRSATDAEAAKLRLPAV